MHGGEHGRHPTAPLLDTIDSPADLRSLTPDQLVILAAEIRSFLVDAVANTGGHLGSNLGAVELTLAVHRVFESPWDAILWDTGHQAYVHKLVTGRRDLFTGLRQEGGLSGYPSRAESAHDWLENSHASTALSWAHGLAAAFARQEVRRRVVAVVGDGALTGGMAYEALNNLGRDGSPVVVVLNDNGRSYAPTASRLCPNLAAGAPFFDALGLTYVGPVDGHDIAALDAALRRAAASLRPTVVHVRTTKGLGYGPAETDDEKCLHDVSPFDPVVGPVTAGGARRYTDVFADALVLAGQRDPRVVAVTAAMPGSTGLLPFERAFPDRMFDVGIAEQHAVTTAAGMATGGLRPVVAVYSTFLSRAFDQINLDVGLHRQPVVFCVDRAGITGPDGPSHHGIWDLALLTKVPGMTVLAPSSAEELEVMFSDAMRMDGGPVALRWPNAVAPRSRPGQVGIGLTARCARRGSDVCLLAVGRMVAGAEEAADRLEEIGISATVWDVRVAKPLDPAMITDATRHPLVITVEDGVREGGVGAAIADAVRREVGRGPEVVVLGVPVDYVPAGKAERILARLGLDAEGLVTAASSRLSPVTLMARPSAVGR